MVLLLLLLLTGSIHSMQREMTIVVGTPDSKDSNESFHSQEEENDLCGHAIEALYGSPHLREFLLPYIQDIVRKESHQPDINHVGVLRRLRSGDADDHVNASIHDLVARATQQAFMDKDKKIKSRITKKKAALATTIVGSLTTIIAAIAASYSNKC